MPTRITLKSDTPNIPNKMKQIFLILSIFVLAIGMSSCGKGYNLDKCKTLQEKIDNGDELTQEDYADIIGQAKALTAERVVLCFREASQERCPSFSSALL